MKNKEISFDAAMKLTEEIQNKCTAQRALFIAISAIHTMFENRDRAVPFDGCDDINFVPCLIELANTITDEVNNLCVETSDMIFDLEKITKSHTAS